MKKNKFSNLLLGLASLMTIANIVAKIVKMEFDYVLYSFIAIFIFLALYIVILRKRAKKDFSLMEALNNRLSLWNTISYKVKGAGETVFTKYPYGVIVMDRNLNVSWSNDKAKEILMDELDNRNLKDVGNSILYEHVRKVDKNKASEISDIVMFGKTYHVEYNVENSIIYFYEITDFIELEEKYKNRTLALGYINVDNLEKILSSFDVQGRSEAQGKIINTIAEWGKRYDAYVRAFSDSKYVILTNYDQLQKMTQGKFEILSEIKTIIKTTNAAFLTISMGIACNDVPISELSDHAQKLLDLALNRGGDQVLVNIFNVQSCYGATSDSVISEYKTDVASRYREFESLATDPKYDKIFIMGHNWADTDSFGSCVALYKYFFALGKDVYIIKPVNVLSPVDIVLNEIENMHQTLNNHLVKVDDVRQMVTDDTLLVCVDFQAKSQLPRNFDVEEIFKHIAVLDHHRQNQDRVVQDTGFKYVETAASSCVELILSLFEFIPNDYKTEDEKETYVKPVISKDMLTYTSSEATWMMLGIIIDTNNFVYRTTEDTFRVAARLNHYQADMKKCKEYLKEDISDLNLIRNYMTNFETYKECIAIARDDDSVRVKNEVLAKVADGLLTIKGIDLGVSLGYIDDKKEVIKISARSLSSYNCQTLMESMGGGGHLTAAAAVFQSKTMDEVVDILKQKINVVLQDELKVQFIRDENEIRACGGSNFLPRNLGHVIKKGDVATITREYANQLIKLGCAVVESPENDKILEEEKICEQEAEIRPIKNFEKLRDLLESKAIEIPVTFLDNHVKENISQEMISKAIENAFNKKIDKRIIKLSSAITSLGQYIVNIELHDKVVANVKLNIVDKIKNDNQKTLKK